jgi:hypothetical protein
MPGIPTSDDLKKSIEDFTVACQRWQRAAAAHAALLRIQGGELPPPVLELVVKGENGEPIRIAIDLSHVPTVDSSTILNPLIDFLYIEYKQSLFDAGVAASASHRLLENQERFRVPERNPYPSSIPTPRERI